MHWEIRITGKNRWQLFRDGKVIAWSDPFGSREAALAAALDKADRLVQSKVRVIY